MERTELLSAVKRVAPGLSAKAFTPIFSCFCFTGKALYAYDDAVAMEVPLESPIVGGITGDVLSGWLGSCHGKDVEVLEDTGKSVKLKCGRSTITLAMIPVGDFVFKWPKKEGVTVPIDPEAAALFIAAMGRCVLSMGRDPSAPKQLGVTLSFTDESVTLYSTTSYHCSMSRMEFAAKGAPEAVQLPPKFCDLLANAKDVLEAFVIRDASVEARFKSGLRMFTRTGGEPDVALFQRVFSKETRVGIKETLRDVPKGIQDAVDRSMVILATSRDKLAKLSVKDGVLTMATSATAGDIKDTLKLPDHPDVSVTCDMPMLKVSLPGATHMAILGTIVAVRGPGFTHIMAATAKETKKEESPND